MTSGDSQFKSLIDRIDQRQAVVAVIGLGYVGIHWPMGSLTPATGSWAMTLISGKSTSLMPARATSVTFHPNGSSRG